MHASFVFIKYCWPSYVHYFVHYIVFIIATFDWPIYTTAAVDNTFMSPYLQHPLQLGASIVVHSVTKYISGHSDVLMGAVITNSDEIAQKLRAIQNLAGAVPSPFECYLALRGLKTLHLRMEASQKNAIAVASFLEGHPAIEKATYLLFIIYKLLTRGSVTN